MIDSGSGFGAAAALDPALRADIVARHRAQALELLAEALAAWRDTGYTRYDHREVSCTVRVFAAMLDILRAREQRELVQIFPQIEGVQTTRDQLAGRSNFSKAKRADLVLYLGGAHSHRICVECKRLYRSATGARYAKEGILRFVNGDYIGDRGKAFMVGYVMSKPVAARVDEINLAITSLPKLGGAHKLCPARAIGLIQDVHGSTHGHTNLVLTHLFVDLRTSMP